MDPGSDHWTDTHLTGLYARLALRGLDVRGHASASDHGRGHGGGAVDCFGGQVSAEKLIIIIYRT